MAGVSETRVWNDVMTTTLQAFQNDLQDQIFDDYPLLSYMNGKLGKSMRGGKTIKKTQDGGERIVAQLMYESNSTAAAFSGAQVIDTTPQDGMTVGIYDWKNYAATVTITGEDKRKNKGKQQLINLLEAKKTQSIQSLKDLLSRDAFGDGTGSGGKALTGLATLISASTTVAGLAPGTYTWWKPTSNTSVGSWAAGGKNALRSAVNSTTFGNDKVDCIFTDQTTYEYVEQSEDSKERFVNASMLDLGFDNITFKRIPIIFDRDCTAGTMYGLNSKYLNFYVHPDADFTITPFVSPGDQDVSTAKILMMGNLVTNNRRKHFVLSGITA